MKKKIVALILAVLMICSLVGCANIEVATPNKDEYSSRFIVVEQTSLWVVAYDQHTKVMYAISYSQHNFGTFTMLVDSDGKPLLYEGE